MTTLQLKRATFRSQKGILAETETDRQSARVQLQPHQRGSESQEAKESSYRRKLTLRQAMPPICTMLEAPLKEVDITRVQSLITGKPSAKVRALGQTVQPRRTPVKPAYLEKEQVSMATSSAPARMACAQVSRLSFQ